MWLPDRSALTRVFLMVLALAMLGLGLTNTPISRYLRGLLAAPREGAPAPDFTLPALDGTERTLSDLRGQVVIVNLWTSWCPPCRAEMPALDEVYQRYRGDGLAILAVNSTIQDSESAATVFGAELHLNFPILLDRNGAVTRRYQLQSLPTTFFVDRQGIIRDIVPGGPMSVAVIEAKIGDLLLENPER